MGKKHEQHEAVITEAEQSAEVVTSAVEQIAAEVEPTVETTVEQNEVATIEAIVVIEEEPQVEQLVVTAEEIKVEEPVVIPEPEVKAEEPKIVVTAPQITPQGTVIEQRWKNTPGVERRYRLIKHPPMYPRGRQRAITYELLKKAIKDGKPDISAQEMVKDANALGYQATAEHVLSLAWHLNQMLIQGQVEMTSGRISIPVERGVTLAEATAKPAQPMSLIDAVKAGLVKLTADEIAAIQLAAQK